MDKLHYVQKGENEKIQEILKILEELTEILTYIRKEEQEQKKEN